MKSAPSRSMRSGVFWRLMGRKVRRYYRLSPSGGELRRMSVPEKASHKLDVILGLDPRMTEERFGH
ncbi:hypothetical protein AGR4A_Cc260035 [Agrobacterium tumefaciens str. B6]|uniref:Uncharacterized protein n=1 Tax=Agrobacterium tumefaciens str. B6 TaxID=1183423 RepID=A0A822V285_AGRTU|nr:hypothetical protein AGR4A_Cc260035 [Agrobacterium tumefaciens str. B6]